MAVNESNNKPPSVANPYGVQPLPHECVDRPHLKCPACKAAENNPFPEVPIILSLLLLMLMLFTPGAAHAVVGGYTASQPDVNFVDNTSNCISTAAFTCWTKMPSTVAQVSVAADGTVYAITSSGTVYTLPETQNGVISTWVASSLPTISQVAVQNSTTVYGLKQGSCPAGYYQVFKSNTALNGWVANSVYGCGQHLTVSFDGTLGVYSNGVVFILKPGATSWMTVTGTGWTTKVTVRDQHVAYALKGSAVYTINLDTNTATVMSGLSASDISVDFRGVLWLIGGNNAQGNGNIYSLDTMNSGAPLLAYRGLASHVESGSIDYTFVLASDSILYHFRHMALGMGYGLTGSYDCAASFPGTGRCPVNSFHTATVTIAFNSQGLHGAAGATSTAVGNPNVLLNPNAFEVGTGCDLLFGNPDSPECTLNLANTVAKVFCSVMGWIFRDSGGQFVKLDFEPAITKSKYTGISVQTGFINHCQVTDYCAAGGGPVFGNPPLASYSSVDQLPLTILGPARACSPYYLSKSLCERHRLPGGTWSLFHCAPDPLGGIIGEGSYGTTLPDLGQCTGSWAYFNSKP